MGRLFEEIGLDKSIPHLGVLMKKADTAHFPHYALPEGYRFVYYQNGMERDWMELQTAVEHAKTREEVESIFVHDFVLDEPDWNQMTAKTLDTASFYQSPRAKELAERMFFVVDSEGHAVATMTLWFGKVFGPAVPRIHWVAVLPEMQGKGIARAMLTEVLALNLRLGVGTELYLATQTWSHRAIYLYQKFDFVPYIGEELKDWRPMDLDADTPWDYQEAQEQAWHTIYEKIAAYRPK